MNVEGSSANRKLTYITWVGGQGREVMGKKTGGGGKEPVEAYLLTPSPWTSHDPSVS